MDSPLFGSCQKRRKRKTKNRFMLFFLTPEMLVSVLQEKKLNLSARKSNRNKIASHRRLVSQEHLEITAKKNGSFSRGVLDISLGREVRPDHSNPNPVYDKNRPIFYTLFKTFNPKSYPV